MPAPLLAPILIIVANTGVHQCQAISCTGYYLSEGRSPSPILVLPQDVSIVVRLDALKRGWCTQNLGFPFFPHCVDSQIYLNLFIRWSAVSNLRSMSTDSQPTMSIAGVKMFLGCMYVCSCCVHCSTAALLHSAPNVYWADALSLRTT